MKKIINLPLSHRLNSILMAILLCLLNHDHLYAAEKAPPFDGMAFQSHLVDSSGNPVVGTKSVKFGIFDASNGTNLLWGETQTIFFTDGNFSVILGQGTWDTAVTDDSGSATIRSLADVFASGGERYLQITLDTQVLEPRLRLLPSAYSFRALTADKLNFNDKSVIEVDAFSATIDGNLNVGSSTNSKELKTFGDITTTSKFVGNGVIPVKGIIMWGGTENEIPSNWALCNGQVVDNIQTPDLSGRFIVGTGTLGSDTYSRGATSVNGEGKSKVTLTVKQMPSHTHSITDPGHTHTVLDEWLNVKDTQAWPGSGRNSTWVADDSPDVHPKESARRISSKAFTKISVNAAGGNEAHENRPPYYALAYIMRVK
ncbi:MAG: hypothetical protein ACJZ70_01015 [Limisphaerales bacterium]